MPQADGGGRKPKVKKVKPKSVGKAISDAGKGKKVDFGPKVKPKRSANAGVGAPSSGVVKKKVNPRVAADPRPTPKLKRAGVLPNDVGVRLSPLGKATTVPVLKALDVSVRPLYAVMNAQKQKLINEGLGNPAKKGSVVKAAGRGLSGEDKTVGSDVLKQAGVKNRTVRAIGGFAADTVVIAGYPGLRGGSLAKSALENAGAREAKRVAKKAAVVKPTKVVAPKPRPKDVKAREGFDQASRDKRFGEMARRQAEKGRTQVAPVSRKRSYVRDGRRLPAEVPRGAWVGIGYGREGQIRLRKRTDRTLMGEPKKRSKLATRVSNEVRGVVHQVRPTVRPKATDSPVDAERALAIRAEERAVSNAAYDRAIHQQESIQRGLKREDYARIVDAIERNQIGKLPSELQEPAKALRSNFRYQNRLRRRAGRPHTVGKAPASRQITLSEIPEKTLGRKLPASRGSRVVMRPSKGDTGNVDRIVKSVDGQRKPVPVDEGPSLEKLSRNVRPSKKPGFSIEDEYVRLMRDGKDVGFADRKVPGSGKVVVSRDKDGKINGVLSVLMDKDGNPTIVEVAVAKDARRKGIASGLIRHAHGNGIPMDKVSADNAFTEAGGALAKRLASSEGERLRKPVLKPVVVRDSSGGGGRDVAAYLKRVEREADKRPATKPKASGVGYVPHMREADLRSGTANTDTAIYGTRGGGTGVGTTKKREVNKPISEQNPKLPEGKQYSTDLSVVHPNAVIQTGRVEAKGVVARGAAEMGEPVKIALRRTKKGDKLKRRLDIGEIPEGKVLVHIGTPSRSSGGTGPRVQVVGSSRKEMLESAEALKSGKGFDGAFKGGQFRIVDESAIKTLKESAYEYKQLRYDKVLSTWKSVATATPTFQMRNLVGDTERAFTLIPRRKMPRLMAEAPKISRFMRSQQFRVAGPPIARGKGIEADTLIDLGKSGKISAADFVKELKDQHIISAGIRGQDIRASGTIGRDITFGADVGKTARVNRALKDTMSADYGNLPGRRFNEMLQTRENLPYIMVYKHFREEGFTPRQARAKTMDRMIDYGELTPFEAGTARRIAPFYTFSARVVPAYAKAFVKDPGKIANYEALRQEVGNFFGVDANDIEKEAKFVQRGAGIPVKYKGETFYVSYGLPLTQGLNELPIDGVNKDYARELTRYGISILAPWWKAAIEVLPVSQGGPGWNFFFESPVQSKTSPYVPAPVVPGADWADAPKWIRDKLGVVEYTNGKGVRQWGWDGYKSYLWNIPMTGTPGFAFRIGQASNQRHQSQAQSALSFVSGAKIDRSDPLSAAISNTFEYIDGLETARGRADKRYGKESGQYKTLNEKITAAKRFLHKLSQQRGDKNPYGLPPEKGRVRKVQEDSLLGGDSGSGSDLLSGSSSSAGSDLLGD